MKRRSFFKSIGLLSMSPGLLKTKGGIVDKKYKRTQLCDLIDPEVLAEVILDSHTEGFPTVVFDSYKIDMAKYKSRVLTY